MSEDKIIREVDDKPLYKVLVDGKSCHGGNSEWRLNEWLSVGGDLTMCVKGLHLTTEPYKSWFKWGCDVYRAEAREAIDHEGDKYLFRSARIVEKMPKPAYIENVEKFIASLNEINWLKPDGKPLPEWRLFKADTWGAARVAARAAALMAMLKIVEDLDFPDKEKHFAHAEARMNVWRKGYALLCDVGGSFYVYAKKEAV